eukprot:1930244-Prymnesium_polylepis.1
MAVDMLCIWAQAGRARVREGGGSSWPSPFSFAHFQPSPKASSPLFWTQAFIMDAVASGRQRSSAVAHRDWRPLVASGRQWSPVVASGRQSVAS